MADDIEAPRKVTLTGPLRAVAIAGAFVLIYAMLPLQGEGGLAWALVALLAIAAIVPLTVRRVHAVQTADRPVLVAVEALFLLLAMLVFGFSVLFMAIAGEDQQFAGLETRIDAVYFTVSTLSTVGYGDVHATGQAARALVIAQIIIDFSLIAVAVRLLTGAAQQRLRDRP